MSELTATDKRKGRISYTELRQKHDFLKKVHDSTNKAVANLHKALDVANEQSNGLRQERDSAQRNATQRREVLHTAMEHNAIRVKELEEEIARRHETERGLRADIERLKRGD